MTEEDHDVAVTTPEQFKALGHPMRHRLLFALGLREATISQLAATLGSNKGNISHHLKVLAAAGLVQAAGTRTVRGGTEQYYRRAFASLTYDDATTTETALRALAAEIAAAEPAPFVILRGLRLSPSTRSSSPPRCVTWPTRPTTGATTRATACCSACTSLHRRPQATIPACGRLSHSSRAAREWLAWPGEITVGPAAGQCRGLSPAHGPSRTRRLCCVERADRLLTRRSRPVSPTGARRSRPTPCGTSPCRHRRRRCPAGSVPRMPPQAC